MSSVSFSIYQGDTATMVFNFKDSAGVAVPLTGKTLTVTAKKSLEDTDAEAVFQKVVTSHSNAAGGVTSVSLTSANTASLGNLWIDAVLTGGGDVRTLFVGSLTIARRVKDV
jgi:hypothetical protein